MAENLLDSFTTQALKAFGHLGSTEHYRRLREARQLCATRCDDCGETAYPGRSFCPDCHSEQVAWVPIGEGATLYAFTTQTRALRFTAPAVIGVVDIPDVGLVVSPIAGAYDSLTLGMPLELEVVDMGNDLTIHRFTPAQ